MSMILILAAAAAGQAFTCTPTGVAAGDGPILCAEGPKVALAGIAAPPVNESCAQGQPCADRSGVAARDRIVQALGGAKGRTRDGYVLVQAAPMRCTWAESGKIGTLAACSVGRSDLGCMMVHEGYALPAAERGGARRCSAVG